MDWTALISAALALINSFAASLRSPPVNPTVPSPVVVVLPDQAVKDLQTFLNLVLVLNPPLVVDGRLGPKTDAAIEQGLAKLRALGLGAH